MEKEVIFKDDLLKIFGERPFETNGEKDETKEEVTEDNS